MNKEAVREYLLKQLPIDEGVRLEVYPDTKGIPTIGVGRNLIGKGLSKEECNYLGIPFSKGNELVSILTKRKITRQEAFHLLNNDIDEVIELLEQSFGCLGEQPDVVWCVLTNMCFNVGLDKLKKFVKTLELIKNKEYKKASVEMLNSKWATDVGKRAYRLSTLLKTI